FSSRRRHTRCYRDWSSDVCSSDLGRTSNPQTALANLLARDALYTEEVERQAATLQLTRIQVNGSASVDELAKHVAQCLGIRRRRSEERRVGKECRSRGVGVR